MNSKYFFLIIVTLVLTILSQPCYAIDSPPQDSYPSFEDDSYISTTAANGQEFNSGFTFTGWFKFNKLTGNQNGVAGYNWNSLLIESIGDNSLNLWIKQKNITITNLQLNQWINLAVTISGTHVKWYLDGALLGEQSLDDSSFSFPFNQESNFSVGNFWGHVKQFKIWDRTLSEEELQQAITLSDSQILTPIHQWIMDEGVGFDIANTGTSQGTIFSSSSFYWSNIHSPYALLPNSRLQIFGDQKPIPEGGTAGSADFDQDGIKEVFFHGTIDEPVPPSTPMLIYKIVDGNSLVDVSKSMIDGGLYNRVFPTARKTIVTDLNADGYDDIFYVNSSGHNGYIVPEPSSLLLSRGQQGKMFPAHGNIKMPPCTLSEAAYEGQKPCHTSNTSILYPDENAELVDFDIRTYGHGTAMADIDRDGDMDLYSQNYLGGERDELPISSYFLINDGQGNFVANWQLVPHKVFQYQYEEFDSGELDGETKDLMYSFSVMDDFDGDGYVDMALTGNITKAAQLMPPATPFSIENENPWQSVYEVVAWGGENGFSEEYSILESTLPDDLSEVIRDTHTLPLSIDIDNDGDKDLIVGRTGGTDDSEAFYLQVFRNEGGRVFVDKTDELIPQASDYVITMGKHWVHEINSYDFNNDGCMDFLLMAAPVIANRANEYVTEPFRIWINNCEGHFSPARDSFIGKMGTLLPLDIDGDGGVDFVTTTGGHSSRGDSVISYILKQTGTVEIDYFIDTDRDGLLDSDDVDDDGDGVVDVNDVFSKIASESMDTDGDGIGNNADTDDDGDMYLDVDEIAAGSDPLNNESLPLDTDGDFIPDVTDTDDDGDGIVDENDPAPLDPLIGDTLAPVFSSIVDVTVEATGVVTFVELDLPEVTDDNLNAPTLVSDNNVALTLGSHEITWTATDYAGNISTAIQLVHIVDTTAPEFSELTVQTVDARGLLTDIASDIDILATDLVDGEVAAAAEGDTSFTSGEHTLEVTVQDKSGNTATTEVIVHINPIVELGQDNQVEAGASYEALIALSGRAASYPVVIDYELSGVYSGDSSGELIIESNDKAFIELNIDENAQVGEVLTLKLTSATNAVLITNNEMMLTVVDENKAPTVNIVVEQDNKPINIIDAQGGLVKVTAMIDDLNQFDTHSVTWDVGDSAFVDKNIDDSDYTFEFEPMLLTSGSYGLSVKVIESNTSDSFENVVDINLVVEAELAELSDETDTDNDGISDANEGYADSDQDGISDYLDDDSNTSRLPLGDNSTPMQTINGLHLSVGDVVNSSQSVASRNAIIDVDDIATNGGENGSAVDNAGDTHFELLSNIINFNVTRLPKNGDTVPIVIPLINSEFIPANAVYRKYRAASGWFTFVTNDKNTISSALKDSDGNCPSPLSDMYEDGLLVNNNCIQLLIEDGGANDADGMANGIVKDPGVLATEIPNKLPQISLVSSLSVTEETVVNLDASATTDADGDPLTYVWTQLSGTTVELINENTSIVHFTSPKVSEDEVLSFELTVNDGFDIVITTIDVTVHNVNNAPTVSIDSHSISFNEGASVSLSSTSSDPDGDEVSYSWTQTSGPMVTLSGATTATVSFIAPQVSSNQTIQLTLSVSDGDLTATKTTDITVKDVPDPTPKAEESSGGGGSIGLWGLIALVIFSFSTRLFKLSMKSKNRIHTNPHFLQFKHKKPSFE